jgi:hypothetical protein
MIIDQKILGVESTSKGIREDEIFLSVHQDQFSHHVVVLSCMGITIKVRIWELMQALRNLENSGSYKS